MRRRLQQLLVLAALLLAHNVCSSSANAVDTFNLDEFEAKYEVSFNELIPVSDSTRRVRINTPAANLACLINSLDEQHAGTNSKTLHEMQKAANALNETCLQYHAGWWSYEVCRGRHVLQYHQSKSPTDSSVEQLLGVFNSQTTATMEGGMLVEHVFGGEVCDKTQQPRDVMVQYMCGEERGFTINQVAERELCRYRVVVRSSEFCHEKIRHREIISCNAHSTDINPPRYPVMQAGDHYTGVYHCNGEQLLNVTISNMARWEGNEQLPAGIVGNAVLNFETEVRGSYAILFYIEELSLTTLTSFERWINQPPEYEPLDLDGFVSADGLRFFGILPGCFAGPFRLMRDEAGEEKELEECRQGELCDPAVESSDCPNNGPYAMPCLRRLWREAGCQIIGTHSPDNAPTQQLQYWQGIDLKAVRIDMGNFATHALSGRQEYKRMCYGEDTGSFFNEDGRREVAVEMIVARFIVKYERYHRGETYVERAVRNARREQQRWLDLVHGFHSLHPNLPARDSKQTQQVRVK
eukprot:m.109487 g.109487  ORF g.109487 m.109487 type:complete len:524 (+) comp15893_c0_seq1:223-1794(+)